MYAVIETGGKQYRVEVGTQLEVERLEAEAGSSIRLERVLLVADGDQAAIGRPLVADAEVSAEVVRQDRGEKLIVFKYRPKARRRVKKGHRQDLTVLRISDIVFGGRSAAEDSRKAEEAAQADRQRLEEAAARQAAEDAALAAKLAARTEPKAERESRSTAKARSKATGATGKAGEPSERGPAGATQEAPTKEKTAGSAPRGRAPAARAKAAGSEQPPAPDASSEAGSADESPASGATKDSPTRSKPRRKKDE
jgi:large subunit ribosomal protein L21